MQKATDFMTETLSNRGGFLMLYSEESDEVWGEIPARPSMIWVQDPATVGMGQLFLQAYRATKDKTYLEQAEKAADALLSGQHESGGWRYFIDFEPEGTAKWHEEIGSQCWGWEEFYYNCGNATFDDSVTTGVIRFLMDLTEIEPDPKYREALEKGLGFVLKSQYPDGGWPQRYPICSDDEDVPHPNYTAYRTFNDDVTIGNIELLLDAYGRYGDRLYRETALRGMDFVAEAQLDPPQAGWADQYTDDLEAAAARSYEPMAISTGATIRAIDSLQTFYQITGATKYLGGIPAAIDWMRNSPLPEDQREGRYTHATFYEPASNKPLYAHREGTSKETGRYWVDYSTENILRGYGYRLSLNVDAIEKEYLRVAALSPLEASQEYRSQRDRVGSPQAPGEKKIRKLLDSMDERGAWVETISVPDSKDYMNTPNREFRGIDTATFLRNMRMLLAYLESGAN
jgi:PelA/Pel-15E family pectate lyase